MRFRSRPYFRKCKHVKLILLGFGASVPFRARFLARNDTGWEGIDDIELSQALQNKARASTDASPVRVPLEQTSIRTFRIASGVFEKCRQKTLLRQLTFTQQQPSKDRPIASKNVSQVFKRYLPHAGTLVVEQPTN